MIEHENEVEECICGDAAITYVNGLWLCELCLELEEDAAYLPYGEP
jgi:hypothetical protein